MQGNSSKTKKENVPKLETGKVGRKHCLKSSTMERLFNALPYELQNLTDVETDMFKKHLDNWLRTIPDTPKIDGYGASVPAVSNSIVDQCMAK